MVKMERSLLHQQKLRSLNPNMRRKLCLALDTVETSANILRRLINGITRWARVIVTIIEHKAVSEGINWNPSWLTPAYGEYVTLRIVEVVNVRYFGKSAWIFITLLQSMAWCISEKTCHQESKHISNDCTWNLELLRLPVNRIWNYCPGWWRWCERIPCVCRNVFCFPTCGR